MGRPKLPKKMDSNYKNHMAIQWRFPCEPNWATLDPSYSPEIKTPLHPINGEYKPHPNKTNTSVITLNKCGFAILIELLPYVFFFGQSYSNF